MKYTKEQLRYLDVLIAEKAFNKNVYQDSKGQYWENVGPIIKSSVSIDVKMSHSIPEYSSNIYKAWDLVDKISEEYCVCVYPKKNDITVSCFKRDDLSKQGIAREGDLPLAIAVALLKAVGVDYEGEEIL